jgi:ATP-dependent RNA helicase DeaD
MGHARLMVFPVEWTPNIDGNRAPEEDRTGMIDQGESEKSMSEQVLMANADNANADPNADPNADHRDRESAEPHFRDFALSDAVQAAVERSGYTQPTEVQQRIIPHLLEGRDVLAQSQTGSGKTAAFALPLLSTLDTSSKLPKVLVLAPTRELALQVARSFSTYGVNLSDLRILAVFGGTAYESQFRALSRGVDVVVGTPGRVIDHLKRGTLDLSDLTSVVLDEADEMLNLGFIEDIEWILEQTPVGKQTALFSATMPGPIRRVADQHLTDPEVVTVRQKSLTADTIEQRCIFAEQFNKPELLARLLETEETDGVIVFAKTKDSTIELADHLTAVGFKAAALNGDMPQPRREKTVEQLKSGRLDVLVATDVAARGLDVQRISHVVNYDLPHDSESYVHRIGRTGRAGRSGVAYIFLTPRQRRKLKLIEKATNKSIQICDPPSTKMLNQARIERFKQQINNAAGHDDHALFRKIIGDHVNESGMSLEDVAAAVAALAQAGKPLLADELPKHSARRQRDSGSGQGPKRDTNRKGGRKIGKPEQGRTRFWLAVGKVDGVRPGNIVGAIANEVGIPGSEIGPISIRENYSTVDLPTGLPNDVIGVLQQTWVSGKQLRVRPYKMRADDDQGFEGGSKRKRKDSKRDQRGRRAFAEQSNGDAPGKKRWKPKSNGAKRKPKSKRVKGS